MLCCLHVAELIEKRARLVKAIALADLLDAAGIPSQAAAAMEAEHWALLAMNPVQLVPLVGHPCRDPTAGSIKR